MTAVSPMHKSHWRPVPPVAAKAWLGFSGAILTIQSFDDPKRPGTARRRMILKLPNRVLNKVTLQDGGGHAGNNALNLYRMSNSDNFILVSEQDCQIIDPIKGGLKGCKKEKVCKEGKAYIGRFDWMNAYDPPDGEFRFGFRFLPAADAWENGGC
jgi:hypothetical protein